MNRITLSCILFLAALGSLAAEEPAAPQGADPADSEMSAGEKAIHRALEQPIDLDVTETPFGEILEKFAKAQGIQILIDERALREVGIDRNASLSFRFQKVRLRHALDFILKQMDLAYFVWTDALEITTPEVADGKMRRQVYPVGDLLRDLGRPGTPPNGEPLIALIVDSFAPTTWDRVGGPGGIQMVQSSLVVAQYPRVHRPIPELLAALRKCSASYDAWDRAGRKLPEVPPEGLWRTDNGDRDAWNRALAKPVSFDIQDQEIPEVAEQVRKLTGLDVQVDEKSLRDIGIDAKTRVTYRCRELPLKAALRHLLSDFDLVYLQRGGMLVITTYETQQDELDTVVIPVFDLAGAPMLHDLGITRRPYSADDLIAAIHGTVTPTEWDIVGGRGSIRYYSGSGALVVQQSNEVLEEIMTLLRQLRRQLPVAKKVDSGQLEKELISVLHGPFVPQNTVPRQGPDGKLISPGPFPLDPSSLADLITSTIEPTSWKKEDNGPRIQVVRDRLLIRQTRAVHARIAQLMESLGTSSGNDALPPRPDRGPVGSCAMGRPVPGGGIFRVPEPERDPALPPIPVPAAER